MQTFTHQLAIDIQQSDKESLAAYVHHFKWEANRCKFNNDATTIRIFLKGLKNAHTLATKVYEKGPQSLADAIKEVEKLQGALQITSTLIPTSSVNTMSSDNDKCFQCQETGHMACYHPHIKCFDCPDKILPSGTPACCGDNTNSRSDRSSPRYHSHTMNSHHHYRDRHRFSCSQSCSHNPGYRSNSCHDSHRSCSRSFHRPSHLNSSCHRSSSSYCYHCDTPHHTSSSHRNFSKMTVEPECINPASNIINWHKDCLPVCKQCLGKTRTEGTNRSQLMTLPQNTTVQMSRIVTQRII